MASLEPLPLGLLVQMDPEQLQIALDDFRSAKELQRKKNLCCLKPANTPPFSKSGFHKRVSDESGEISDGFGARVLLRCAQDYRPAAAVVPSGSGVEPAPPTVEEEIADSLRLYPAVKCTKVWTKERHLQLLAARFSLQPDKRSPKNIHEELMKLSSPPNVSRKQVTDRMRDVKKYEKLARAKEAIVKFVFVVFEEGWRIGDSVSLHRVMFWLDLTCVVVRLWVFRLPLQSIVSFG
ncbi:unnamed protein product [Arabis nemorensis]|uniref:Uncharacterized protein n=1 Tax=Arabis nemorensis TaxID=586526 RepID=A0A565B996_9BRAS|nr:unnamed protein product [Arabis nemorensis]